jgi:hypothetical protein
MAKRPEISPTVNLRSAAIEGFLDDVERALDWHLAELQGRYETVADQMWHLAEATGAVAKLKDDLARVEKARDWQAAELRNARKFL